MINYPFLDCPKCGRSTPETDHEELVYYCTPCLEPFEAIRCPHCKLMVGHIWGQHRCSNCGNDLYDDSPPSSVKPGVDVQLRALGAAMLPGFE